LLDDIKKNILESIQTKKEFLEQADQISEIIELIQNSLHNNGKIILCGNGGSAADSQHIAAEFIGKFQKKRNPIPALALTTNTSTITAISNDFSFEQVFVRQIEALCNKSDIVIGISTSGNSANVISAIEAANKIGAVTIGWTGKVLELINYL